MKAYSVIAFLGIALALAACGTDKVEVMKSPCASAADDGPCGPKRPVNDWWMNKTHKPV